MKKIYLFSLPNKGIAVLADSLFEAVTSFVFKHDDEELSQVVQVQLLNVEVDDPGLTDKKQ